MSSENDVRDRWVPRPAYVRESDPGSWAWGHPAKARPSGSHHGNARPLSCCGMVNERPERQPKAKTRVTTFQEPQLPLLPVSKAS